MGSISGDIAGLREAVYECHVVISIYLARFTGYQVYRQNEFFYWQHTWISPYTLGEESTVTVTFKKSSDNTIMTLVHSDLPDDEMANWNHFMDLFPKQFGKK